MLRPTSNFTWEEICKLTQYHLTVDEKVHHIKRLDNSLHTTIITSTNTTNSNGKEANSHTMIHAYEYPCHYTMDKPHDSQ